MKAKGLLRIDTAVLLTLQRLGDQVSIPQIELELERLGIDIDNVTLRRCTSGLQADGLVSFVGHVDLQGRYTARAYSMTPAGHGACAERIFFLHALLTGSNPQREDEA